MIIISRFINKLISGYYDSEAPSDFKDPLEELENLTRGQTKRQIISRLIRVAQDEMTQYFEDDPKKLSAVLSSMQTLLEVCTSDWFLNERE